LKQLKAFTIIELIVVMIISIITLATIYTVYVLVKKQFLRQTKKIELLNSYLQFKNVFDTDFNNADSVKGDTQLNTLICYHKTDTVLYNFSDRTINRQQNVFVDSFILFPHNLKISLVNSSDLVKEIEINIVPFSDTVVLQLRRKYDATSLIKSN
jgi:type II secretory pathway component PulJ